MQELILVYCFAETENTICDLGCLFKNLFMAKHVLQLMMS